MKSHEKAVLTLEVKFPVVNQYSNFINSLESDNQVVVLDAIERK